MLGKYRHLQAYNAKEPTSAISMMTYVREYLARAKMFLDIWTDKQPSSLEDGEPIGIQIIDAICNLE